jgi:hypothetical protein
MRRYSKVCPQFWIGETGRKLREAGQDALLVALYLLTNPHANMLGLFYIPASLMAHETGLSPEGASEGLRRAIDAGFCAYDESSETVFVYEMARYQIADQLLPSDKQCAGIQREYEGLPNNPFLAAFYEKYAKAFHLTFSRENQRPSEGASKAHRSQEQEQEQDKNITSEPETGSDPASASSRKNPTSGPSHQACRLVSLLKSEILRNKPDYRITPVQERNWAVTAQRMLDLDQRSPERIERVIRWVQRDEFEMANVLSFDKLRKRFDQLELKAGIKGSKPAAVVPLPASYVSASEKILQERSAGGLQ